MNHLKRYQPWHGLISLIWLYSIFGVLTLLARLKVNFLEIPILLIFLLYFVGWLGIGLLLATSGVKTGHPFSQTCALLSLLSIWIFAETFILPAVR
ncbi:MAG TPA: hypothetical protein VGH19_08325 [Verrucomicrobiae bacterium]